MFEDVTEMGSELCVEPLIDNEYGPRLGLCGKRFYCEISRDSERSDTLFVARIENALARMPSRVPTRRQAEISLLLHHDRYKVAVEPVLYLFAGNDEVQEEVEVVHPRGQQPGPVLLEILRSVPADLRAVWRPRVESPVQVGVADYL